ncbi:MAG: hypothetical protein H7832_01885 [Magnetococcus sp. DMHC-6]
MAMVQCPVCRARLEERSICRRCGTDFTPALTMARESMTMAGHAVYHLIQGEVANAALYLRRATLMHATPFVLALETFVQSLSSLPVVSSSEIPIEESSGEELAEEELAEEELAEEELAEEELAEEELAEEELAEEELAEEELAEEEIAEEEIAEEEIAEEEIAEEEIAEEEIAEEEKLSTHGTFINKKHKKHKKHKNKQKNKHHF